jgi:hypothetical protein
MLTIIAWMIFVPAVIWNVLLWSILFLDIIYKQAYTWMTKRNLRDFLLSLAILLIPGIFLFGLL